MPVSHSSAFGNRLRSLAQNRLFAALIEKDQVSIAACLQVFFNLNSLLEILMVCIDWCISRTGDVTRRFLLDSTFLNRYPISNLGTSFYREMANLIRSIREATI